MAQALELDETERADARERARARTPTARGRQPRRIAVRRVLRTSRSLAWSSGRSPAWWRKTSSSVASAPIAALSSAGEPIARIVPAVHERDPLAQAVGLVHVVGREQDGHAALLAQLGDEVPHGAAGDRVEADRRLVEDQQPRAVDERLRELQPPDHAARVRRDHAVGVLEHPGRLERPVDPPGPLGPRDVEEAREQHRVLAPGERALGRELLGDVADQPPDRHALARDVVAEHVGDAGRDPQQRGEDADRRRLARAVGAEEAEHLAGPDLEVDRVDGGLLAEAVGEARAADSGRVAVQVGPHRSRSSAARSRSSAGSEASRRRAVLGVEVPERVREDAVALVAPAAQARRGGGREVQLRGAPVVRVGPAVEQPGGDQPADERADGVGREVQGRGRVADADAGLRLDEPEHLDLRAGQRLTADLRPRAAPQPAPHAAPGGGELGGQRLLAGGGAGGHVSTG